MKRGLGVVLAIGALGAGVAACDDDDETNTALTKAGWITQADQICADVNQELDKVKDFEKEAPPLIDQAFTDLRALPAPEGDETQVDEMLTAGEDGLADLEAGKFGENTFDTFTRLAEDYGLEGGCTENRQST